MMRRFAVLVLWMLAATSIGIAQDRPEDTRLVQTVPGNCEINAAALDSVRSEALEEANKGGVVIVIARLGTRETSGMQNRRRLQIVKTYLRKYGLGAQRIVAAEGERVDGYGRVEFYVAGKLRVVILANRNKPICVECCNPDDTDLYPDKRNRSGTTKKHAGNKRSLPITGLTTTTASTGFLWIQPQNPAPTQQPNANCIQNAVANAGGGKLVADQLI